MIFLYSSYSSFFGEGEERGGFYQGKMMRRFILEEVLEQERKGIIFSLTMSRMRI